MRSPFGLTLVVLGLTFAFVAAGSAAEKPYFDFVNCDLCKVWMEDPMLMQNVKWEQYDIPSGVVTITNVADEALPSYRAAHDKMVEQLERIERGDSLYLCGHCTDIGRLIECGAKYEYTETEHGDVSVIIADNPELIADIKAVAARGREEAKKMETMHKEGMEK